MKYTAAYLLAAMNEKRAGSAVAVADITAMFEAAGISFDEELVKLVVSKMEGKSVSEIVAAGIGKLESTGGGGGGAAAGGAAAGAGAAAGGAAEAKKEEAPPEEEEEDMDFD